MDHYHWAWTNVVSGMSWPVVVIAALATLALVQSAVLVHLARLSGRAVHSEERLNRLNEVITLLTETSESGFRAVAAEVERLSTAAPVRRTSKATASRITRSARQGRAIADIAADEQVSQGEVRLRLHLAHPALLEQVEGERARG
jgi:hypothetical protein